jgi:hypothetical protein
MELNAPIHEHVLNQYPGLVPERAEPLLPTLAHYAHLGGSSQSDTRQLEIDDLLGSGTGIIEKMQKCRVPAASWLRAIDEFQNVLDFFTIKAGNQRGREPFVGDGKDTLGNVDGGRILLGYEAKE